MALNIDFNFENLIYLFYEYQSISIFNGPNAILLS